MAQIELNEPVQVLVDFRPAAGLAHSTSSGRSEHWSKSEQSRRTKVIPRAFLWKNRRYLINSLNLVHKQKQGDAVIYYFSVSTDTNTYKLSFNNLTLEWYLVEIWNE